MSYCGMAASMSRPKRVRPWMAMSSRTSKRSGCQRWQSRRLARALTQLLHLIPHPAGGDGLPRRCAAAGNTRRGNASGVSVAVLERVWPGGAASRKPARRSTVPGRIAGPYFIAGAGQMVSAEAQAVHRTASLGRGLPPVHAADAIAPALSFQWRGARCRRTSAVGGPPPSCRRWPSASRLRWGWICPQILWCGWPHHGPRR